jgi:broad specificity phosphatase PhoE
VVRQSLTVRFNPVRPHARLIVTLAVWVLTVVLMVAPGLAGDDASDAWAALARGGHVALIRHGNAPPGSGGDPPGFRLDDCKTQRNLDDIGRAQARALGEAFRQHSVRVDRIVASPVCRCMETAQLMAVGSVETSAVLLPDVSSTRVRLSELEQMISTWRGPGTLVLVSHGIAIAGLTGVTLQQAETLVIQPTEEKRPAGYLLRAGNIVGRIAPPQP